MILEYTAAFTSPRASLLFLDYLVDDTVEGFGMWESHFTIEEQFARDNGLEVGAILTQQLLDYFEL